MSDTAAGASQALHVIRTVRRSQYLGKEIGGGISTGNIDPLSMTASAISVGTTAFNVGVAFGPEAGAAMAIILAAGIGINAASQYIIDGQMVIPNQTLGLSEADQMRHVILQHVYGKDLGNKLWQVEFDTRQTEIDLRAKWPG